MEGRAFLPSNFVSWLEVLVLKYESHRKGEVSISIAPFQADPSIADVAIRGVCEAIFSGDSDFAMYVGPGGPNKLGDIMIRDIKVKPKQSTITCGTMVTGQTHVAREIEEILKHRGLAAVFPAQPKFLLFDGIVDPKICALITLALGCDALPGGVPGMGVSSLHKLLGTCNWNSLLALHGELSMTLANQKKALVKSPNALLCLVNSLIYKKRTQKLDTCTTYPDQLKSTTKHLHQQKLRCLIV